MYMPSDIPPDKKYREYCVKRDGAWWRIRYVYDRGYQEGISLSDHWQKLSRDLPWECVVWNFLWGLLEVLLIVYYTHLYPLPGLCRGNDEFVWVEMAFLPVQEDIFPKPHHHRWIAWLHDTKYLYLSSYHTKNLLHTHGFRKKEKNFAI